MNRRKFTGTVAASATSLVFTASAQKPAAHRPDDDESKRADGVTGEVAEFIVNTTYKDVPGDVMELGNKSILDGLGLALSGSVAETGRLSRAYLKSLGPNRSGLVVEQARNDASGGGADAGPRPGELRVIERIAKLELQLVLESRAEACVLRATSLLATDPGCGVYRGLVSVSVSGRPEEGQVKPVIGLPFRRDESTWHAEVRHEGMNSRRHATCVRATRASVIMNEWLVSCSAPC